MLRKTIVQLFFSLKNPAWGGGDIYCYNPLSDFSLAICSGSETQMDPLTYIKRIEGYSVIMQTAGRKLYQRKVKLTFIYVYTESKAL